MIPQAFIQDLLSRVDVADVVGKHVKLRKAGANLLGLCPFHGEKTPSFTVSPSKQFYHCFGCQANGSAIGFLMAFAGLGYVEAIEELAQSVGLTVPHEARSPGAAQSAAVSPNLIELLTRASTYYRTRLRESPRAIDYLKARGLSGVTAGRFALGYAPPGWRNLEAAVADYEDAALVTAGLVTGGRDQDDEDSAASTSEPADAGARTGRKRKRYDRFRDRVMFPIRNMRGGIIGFGGRVIDNGEPKYLNSPETPVFSKGRELYGLYESRQALRTENQAIVVEGYMDVVMLAEHGVGNAVATLGTATTAEHVRKLLRIVDSLVFSFDGDQAGRKAAWRALQTCLPVISDTQRVHFLFLPEAMDPDSFVREHGAPGLNRAIDKALPLSAFLMQSLTQASGLDTPEGRAAFLAQARPLLQNFAAQGLRMQMMREVADAAGIGLLELERYIVPTEAEQRAAQRSAARTSGRRDEASSDRGSGRAASARGAPRPTRRAGGVAVRGGMPSLERRLRLLLVCQPQLSAQVLSELNGLAGVSEQLAQWLQAISCQPADAGMAVTIEGLRAAGLPGMEDLERDLASDWSGVPQLGAQEAEQEVLGALTQLRRRADALAARELVETGLNDENARRRHRELLASRKTS